MIVRLMTMQPIWTQVGKILQYYGTRQHMSSSNTLVVLSSLRLSVTWPRGKKKKVEWNEWPNSRRKNLFRWSQNDHQRPASNSPSWSDDMPSQYHCEIWFYHLPICFTSLVHLRQLRNRDQERPTDWQKKKMLLYGFHSPPKAHLLFEKPLKSSSVSHWAIKTYQMGRPTHLFH